MSNSPQQKKTLKVGILGDKYVGKTYLACKITGLDYQGYQETTSVFQLKSKDSEQTTKFVYIDNPALDNQSIVNIGSIYQYDILVFLFKDCDSFTKLFEFFDTIKQTLNKQYDYHIRQYWSHPKKIVAAFSNFQQIIGVQLQQLFTILKQQISLFCNKVIYQSFILEKQLRNWKDLKSLIQTQTIIIQTNQEVSEMQKEKNSVTLPKQQSQKQIQLIGEIEQIKKTQIEQYQQRAELLSQQKSEVIIINTQLQQISNIQVGQVAKQIGQVTKQVDTASAQLITQEEKSKQQITSQNAKYNLQKKVSKEGQIQKYRTKNNQKSQIQVNSQSPPQEQIKITYHQINTQHFDQELIKKQDLRKENIMKMIRDSFYGSNIETDQKRKSVFVHQDVQQHTTKTQEVKIQGKNQDLLTNFRISKHQSDSRKDLYLHNFDERKSQNLQNQQQFLLDQEKQVEEQQNKESLNKGTKILNTIQNSNTKKEMKKLPQSQFSKLKKAQKQKKLSKESKNCECQII